MSWYNSNWPYRRKITISGQTGAGTDYQVKLLVGESVDATGENFDLGGHSEKFPSGSNYSGDLRFTLDDHETLLDFWVEEVSGTAPNRLATVWVEVSDSLESNLDVYIYYGNSEAKNSSNGDNTFLFFDDFSGDLSKWTIDDQNTDCIVIDGGCLRHNPDASQTKNSYYDTRCYASDITNLTDFALHYKVYLAGAGARKIHQFGWRTDGLTFNQGYCWRVQNSASDGGFFEFATGAWSNIGGNEGPVSENTWYNIEASVVGSDMEVFYSGISEDTVSDSTTSNGALTSHVHGVTLTGSDYVLVDDVFVRKLITTEPFYNSIEVEEAYAPEVGWTTYGTFIGSTNSWTLKSGQYGVSKGFITNSSNPTSWTIGYIQKSANIYHRVGSVTSWRWVAGA